VIGEKDIGIFELGLGPDCGGKELLRGEEMGLRKHGIIIFQTIYIIVLC
jgi:hypothetical protein